VGRKTVILFLGNYRKLPFHACHESFKESLNRKPLLQVFFFCEQGFKEAMQCTAKQMQQCSSLVQQQQQLLSK
jgi:hypothetical protein